jgi:putative transposase
MMQALGRQYVRYINHTYQRTGTLWEGRYKSSLIDSETYLLTCMRYIELNPVRASMVSHPGEYPWSRYACNASGQHNPLISAHPLYNALGNDAQERHYTYRELFRRPRDHRQIHAIREALNQELVLGREDFKDKIERMTKRQVRPGQPGRPRVEEEQAVYYVL